MRKLILYSALSLDHFIADHKGDIDWLTNNEYVTPGEDFGYAAFYEHIGITVMGNNTYKQVLCFDVPFPYPDKHNYVVSRSKHLDTEYVRFLNSNCIEYINKLKAKSGKNIWLVGGGEVNTLFHDNGLIDQLILTYIPIQLKSGIPLFAADNALSCYQLSNTQSYKNGIIQKIYNKKVG